MSTYTIGQMANPLNTTTHIYQDFTQRLGISLSKNIQVATLTAFAGLVSMLGLGIGTPLIFRTIMTYGLEAISEDPLIDAVDAAISSYYEEINYNRQCSGKPAAPGIHFICHLKAISKSDSQEITNLEKKIETIRSKYNSDTKTKSLIEDWLGYKMHKSFSEGTNTVIRETFKTLVFKLNPGKSWPQESQEAFETALYESANFRPLLDPNNL